MIESYITAFKAFKGPYYAHIEVLVTLLLVNFLGFLVITRDHGSIEVRH